MPTIDLRTRPISVQKAVQEITGISLTIGQAVALDKGDQRTGILQSYGITSFWPQILKRSRDIQSGAVTKRVVQRGQNETQIIFRDETVVFKDTTTGNPLTKLRFKYGSQSPQQRTDRVVDQLKKDLLVKFAPIIERGHAVDFEPIPDIHVFKIRILWNPAARTAAEIAKVLVARIREERFGWKVINVGIAGDELVIEARKLGSIVVMALIALIVSILAITTGIILSTKFVQETKQKRVALQIDKTQAISSISGNKDLSQVEKQEYVNAIKGITGDTGGGFGSGLSSFISDSVQGSSSIAMLVLLGMGALALSR